ncbi:hypothetical protein [Streptomyces sp. Rer75]|nr:hypothetical protein [Streptomyces sp. Rer75]QLH22464.1 hypothetical protein HYQ63_19135 [Streptomyces sp. Rer75]
MRISQRHPRSQRSDDPNETAYVCWAADDAEACREELSRAIAAHLVDGTA